MSCRNPHIPVSQKLKPVTSRSMWNSVMHLETKSAVQGLLEEDPTLNHCYPLLPYDKVRKETSCLRQINYENAVNEARMKEHRDAIEKARPKRVHLMELQLENDDRRREEEKRQKEWRAKQLDSSREEEALILEEAAERQKKHDMEHNKQWCKDLRTFMTEGIPKKTAKSRSSIRRTTRTTGATRSIHETPKRSRPMKRASKRLLDSPLLTDTSETTDCKDYCEYTDEFSSISSLIKA